MSASCTHVAIHARDVGKSVAFYQRYPELVEVHRRVDGATTVVWLGERGHEHRFVIVLIAADHADAALPPPMAHIGYAVASRADVDRLAALAAKDGILLQGATDAGPIVGYFCIVVDPDGNWVEFSFGQSLGTD
jgi:catechol 2,3-dioxygenase-like lactoylglutathione lyase family enzyme